MPCLRHGGCICEGNGFCPNWVHADAMAALNDAYAQPAPDPHACPNCEGLGYVTVDVLHGDDGYEERQRCETCNPNVGEPPDEVRSR